MRSDQEDVLLDLVNEVIKHRRSTDPEAATTVRDFTERTPVGESQCNGVVESGVRSLEGMVRTLKFALEENIQAVVPVQHPVFAWLVELAADLITKFQPGEDGCTAYQRLKKKSRWDLTNYWMSKAP